MKKDVNICIDLGGDTVKIACAYHDDDGSAKISRVIDPKYSDSAIPAIAHYDSASNLWRYGYEIGRRNETSFDTVVKIKDILSIVYKNAGFYAGEHLFPVFNFPKTHDIDEQYYIRYGKEGYDKKKREYYDSLHFEAPSFTPKMVCEGFFKYLADIAESFLRHVLPESVGDVFNGGGVKYTLLYAPKIAKQQNLEGEYSTEDYISEYKRLVMLGFGIKSDENIKLLSSAKALAMMASNSGKVSTEKGALLFDLGEEFISVVKANTHRIKGDFVVCIDGLSGHSDPVKIGGNDIDSAIGESIERALAQKENLGDAAYGESGRTNEKGLKSKTYLFLKSIKSAKSIFSSQSHEINYPHGVPVSVVRDVEVFRNITKGDICESIGIKDGAISGDKANGDYKIAKKISDYVVGELKNHKASNRDVEKIYLCGGVAGTCDLISAVKEEVGKVRHDVVVGNFIECFSGTHSSGDAYAFREKDMYSYAPAVGGALVGLNNLSVRVLLTKTYGTVFEWNDKRVPRDRKSHFSVLVDRGTDLEFEGNPNLTADGKYLEFKQSNLRIFDPETKPFVVYATNITSEDIARSYKMYEKKNGYSVRYFDSPDGSGPYLYIPYGNPMHSDSFGALEEEREAAAIREMLDIEYVTGDSSMSSVCMFYKNRSQPVRRVLSDGGCVFCAYGVRIDREGNVIPFVKNDTERSRDLYINVQYASGGRITESGRVRASEIIMDFKSDKFRFGTPV
ncbi:MAG: hypothetical protein LUD47_03135 [Clostridia bacterium]|nr:hypothetical protein [Clostridia bacterium]